MKHASLFSGIDGPGVAADIMGWETVFHCEINPFGRKILNEHWPKAVSYEDIKTTDFIIWRGRIDVLTGGFPCQPYSLAGKRKGTEDDRHLWPQMLRAIREIAPPWIVGENVGGLISWNGGLVFEQVHANLEAEGYEVQAFVLPAAGVGAPHRRDRVWFVANRSNARAESLQRSGQNGIYGFGLTSDPDSDQRCKGRMYKERSKEAERHISSRDARRDQRDYWRNFPTQSPVCSGDDGFPVESLRWRIRTDCMGIISEKEIDKIVSKAATKWRNETIKAAGNAIVPQVILQIFKTIEQYCTTL